MPIWRRPKPSYQVTASGSPSPRRWVRSAILCMLLLGACVILWFVAAPRSAELPFNDRFVAYQQTIPSYHGPETLNGMPGEDLWIANKGRMVVDEQGEFLFPDTVRRVWIDVGANMLQTTREALFTQSDLAVIAVEPIEQCWNRWPRMDRLIAIPFALDDEEGVKMFHVAESDLWSSLLPAADIGMFRNERRVIEIVPVKVFHLRRLLEMVPEVLSIELLKVDVQGRDLQVLESGKEHLRRVKKIVTEINLTSLYTGDRGNLATPEAPFTDFLGKHGFVLSERKVFGYLESRWSKPTKFYADVTYLNMSRP